MAYDAQSIISAIQTRGKDPDVSDTLVLSWVQEVQDEALGEYRFPFLEVTLNDTLTTNDIGYTLPSANQEVLGLVLTDPDSNSDYVVPYAAYREFDKKFPNPTTETATLPYYWTSYAGVVYWSQPLDKDYLLRLRYLRKPVELTTTTQPDIPQEYKQLLIRGGLSRLEEYRENFDIAAFHARKVEDLTADLLRRYSARQRMTPGKATTSMPYNDPLDNQGWRL